MNSRYAILIILCQWAITVISAQTERQILPADMKQMTVVTQPPTLPKGFFRAGESLTYGLITGNRFDENGKRILSSESSNYWSTIFGLETNLRYGINDRTEVSLQADYQFLREQMGYITYGSMINTFYDHSTILKGKGMSGVRLNAAYQIIPQKEPQLSSLTGGFGISIPAGPKNPRNVIDEENFDLPTSDGHFTSSAYLSYKKVRYPFSYTLEAGYTYCFPGKKAFGVGESEKSFKYGNMYGGSAGVNFHLNEWIALTNEITYYKHDSATIDSIKQPGSSSLYYMGHLVFHVKRFRISEGIYAPLLGKNDITDPMYYFTLEYLF